MAVLAWTLLGLCGAVLLVWMSRHWMIWAQQRRAFLLTEDYPDAPGEKPPLSVVLAVKDEEGNIERCVRTILSQDYPNLEMVVANDRSTDRTGEILARLQKEDSRLRVVNITELPKGWCGKNNAMQHAIAVSRGQWLCMIDSDCRQTSNRTLSAAVSYATAEKADMLSLLPNLEMIGFWENVIQPVCGGMMMVWFHPDKVNDPKKAAAYANGAFILLSRSAYDRIGTHEVVKAEMNEDVCMAGLVKRQGMKLRVVMNRGLYLVRMYTSFPAILRGWTRIFLGSFKTFRRLAVMLVVMLVMGLTPYATAAIGAAVTAAHWPVPPPTYLACLLVGLAAITAQLTVIRRFYGLTGGRPGLAWTYPIACGIGLYILTRSILKLRRGSAVVWRSTAYTQGGS
jgi:cellulose synthase/poly-beta-1,6-N-acetylglucosamine synthase-like glycosyltransferase